jgi:hypothetical protein
MRKLLLAFLALVTAVSYASGAGWLPLAQQAYQGPGDVQSGWGLYYGVWAFTSATRGNALLNACNIGDATCADLSSNATTGLINITTIGGNACSAAISSGTYTTGTGAVVLTTATSSGLASGNFFAVTALTGTGTFISLQGYATATSGTTGTTIDFTGATGLGSVTITGGTVSVCTVKTVYDTSGALKCTGSAPCNVAQATIAGRPILAVSCLGSVPCLVYAVGAGLPYNGAANDIPSQSLPYSFVVVAERTSSFTSYSGLIGTATFPGIFFNNSANSWEVICHNGGASAVVNSVADGSFHAAQGTENGTNCTLNVDSLTQTSVSDVGAIFGTQYFGYGDNQTVHGAIIEAGFVSGTALSSGQISSVNANQHSRNGF